ncbi:MAG: amidohydrolase [Thermaerobacterales bacterium]
MSISTHSLDDALLDDLIKWRRHLHAHPELSFQESETAAFIEARLTEFGVPCQRIGGTGVVGTLTGKRPGPVVAVRADIDALPIDEENDVAYRSQAPGVMHACGHDGHTAILLGLARLFSDAAGDFDGTVKFVFQPAEELQPGGARQLVSAGVLEGVDSIIGLHLIADIPVGKAAIRSGPMMANADSFTVTVEGQGGHGAKPHQTVDALVAAAGVVVDLQQIVSRRVDPVAPAVVSVGTFAAGSASNIIAQRAVLTGTARTFDDETRRLLASEIERVAAASASVLGARATVDYQYGYPAVDNDVEITGVLREAAAAVLGADQVYEPALIMGGEDFSYYQKEVPGAFIFVGAGTLESRDRYPHHHPRFNIDELALAAGLRILAQATLKLLVR